MAAPPSRPQASSDDIEWEIDSDEQHIAERMMFGREDPFGRPSDLPDISGDDIPEPADD